MVVFKAGCSSGRLLLFPLEEGNGEPWFPVLSEQRSCTFLLLWLAGLALILLGKSLPEPVAAPSDCDDFCVMQAPVKDGVGCRHIKSRRRGQTIQPFVR